MHSHDPCGELCPSHRCLSVCLCVRQPTSSLLLHCLAAAPLTGPFLRVLYMGVLCVLGPWQVTLVLERAGAEDGARAESSARCQEAEAEAQSGSSSSVAVSSGVFDPRIFE
jgi:hypothetical protein